MQGRLTHDKFMEATKGASNSKKLKAEREKIDNVRKESETNKIKKAELQKEVQLLEEKCEAISKDVQDRHEQLKDAKECYEGQGCKEAGTAQVKGRHREGDNEQERESTKKAIIKDTVHRRRGQQAQRRLRKA